MIQCKFCGVSIFKQDDHGLRTCLSPEQIEARASHDHEQRVREQARVEFDRAAIELAKWLEGSEFKLEETQIVLSRSVTLGLIEEERK